MKILLYDLIDRLKRAKRNKDRTAIERKNIDINIKISEMQLDIIQRRNKK